MTKKKTKNLVIILCIALLIIALAGVSIWYFFIRNTEPKLEWKSLNEVLEKAPKALNNKYDNLILPDSISLDSPTDLHIIEVNFVSGMAEETAVKTVVELNNMTSKSTITADDVTVEKTMYGDLDAYFYTENNDDPDEYTCIIQGGDCVQMVSPYYLQQVAGFLSREKYYEVGKDDLSSVVYTVDGQKYSAQQAVDFADTVIEKYKDFYKHDKLVPLFVIVGKNDFNDEYSYVVQYGYYFDGIEMNAAGNTFPDRKMQPVYIEVTISSPDKMTKFLDLGTTYNMTFDDIDDSFVTLESALDCTSDLLAEYFIHEIEDIDIVYATKLDMELHDHILEYHPMWRLTTARDYSNDHQMPGRYCIYIDMVTGEIILFNDGTGEFISSKDKETKKS